jgi:hypothetical protein
MAALRVNAIMGQAPAVSVAGISIIRMAVRLASGAQAKRAPFTS